MEYRITLEQANRQTARYILWPVLLLAAAVFICLQVKQLKKLHPIIFIGLAALVGVIFQL